MNVRDIYAIVSKISEANIYNLIDNSAIRIVENPTFEKRKIYSSVLFEEKVIFIKPNLEEEFRQFLLWHEYGHYLLHHNEGSSFNFYLSKFKSKIEMEANLFAFFGIMLNEKLEDMNIIDTAVYKGIPREIAVRVYDSFNQATLVGHYAE